MGAKDVYAKRKFPSIWVVIDRLLVGHRFGAAFFLQPKLVLSTWQELQRGRIDAITTTAGLRTVVKNMTQMTSANHAVNFCPNHSVTRVRQFADKGWFQNLAKAWPTSATFEFPSTVEERAVAPYAKVDAIAVVLPIGVVKRLFCPLLPSDLVLKRAETSTPFIFTEFDPCFAQIDDNLRW